MCYNHLIFFFKFSNLKCVIQANVEKRVLETVFGREIGIEEELKEV